MSRDVAQVVTHLGLEVGTLGHGLGEQPAEVARRTLELLASGHMPTAAKEADVAILYLLARASTPDTTALHPRVVALATDWARSHMKEMVLVQAVIAKANAAQLEQFFYRVVDSHPEAVAISINGSIMLDDPRREQLLEHIAADRRPNVREHLFALLGHHQPLMPPGSVEVAKIASAVLERILRRGIDDAVAAVRQRAIALTYGLGLSKMLAEPLLEHVDDEDVGARRYALLALGDMTDQTSLDVLLQRLERGDRGEIVSAIWSLMRRPDGLCHALALAGDPRPWVQPEVLGAFAEVAPAMTEDQIVSLREQTSSDEFERYEKRHIERTRHGAPERGPSARVTYGIRDRSKSEAT